MNTILSTQHTLNRLQNCLKSLLPAHHIRTWQRARTSTQAPHVIPSILRSHFSTSPLSFCSASSDLSSCSGSWTLAPNELDNGVLASKLLKAFVSAAILYRACLYVSFLAWAMIWKIWCQYFFLFSLWEQSRYLWRNFTCLRGARHGKVNERGTREDRPLRIVWARIWQVVEKEREKLREIWERGYYKEIKWWWVMMSVVVADKSSCKVRRRRHNTRFNARIIMILFDRERKLNEFIKQSASAVTYVAKRKRVNRC